jgi:release factor glutamine methyltransferase
LILPAVLLPAQAEAAYRALRQNFAQAGFTSPDLDASILLKWAAGLDRLAILARPQTLLTDAQITQLSKARDARLSGKPVHRITGRRAFFGLEFALSQETLEPRPDSESVVELALRALSERAGEPLSILDLGTGTGILAISLLSRLEKASAVAVDISAGALATARRNGELNDVRSRLRTLQSDWFENVQGTFDLIISNPPYIRTSEIAALSPEVRDHDPIAALDGGEDGLIAYHSIASAAQKFLAREGLIVLEIGHDQRKSVTAIFERSGLTLVDAAKDIGGNDRGLLFAGET